MRSFATLKNVLGTVGALSLVLTVGACGDDDTHVHPDANVNEDAMVITPDAPVPDATPAEVRAGTIAVTHVTLANAIFPFPISGGAVSISFNDPTTIDPSTVAHQSGDLTAGCTVFNYNVGTSAPPTNTNEGGVSITGNINPNPFPGCGFAPDGAYHCFHRTPAANPDGVIVQHNGLPDPTPALFHGGLITTDITLPGETFDMAGQSEVGMIISIDGFAHPVNNGSFGIIQVLSANQVRVVNTTLLGCVAMGQCNADSPGIGQTVATSNGMYSIVAGEAPIANPFGFTLFPAAGGTPNEITVAKGAPTGAEVLPAFSVNVKPSGEGFVLAKGSETPESMPFTADGDLVFSCDFEGGGCGVMGELVTGFAISGRTTDAVVSSVDPTDMPDAVTSYATFTCTFIGTSVGTIPQAAWQAVLNTNPTRIETRVLRLGAKTNVVPGHSVNIVAGYGYVGFSDPPPATAH